MTNISDPSATEATDPIPTIGVTPAGAVESLPTATAQPVDPPKFKAGYEQAEQTRVHRAKLYDAGDGTATVTFRGQIDDATADLWLVDNGSGRPSLYAEVVTDDSTATTVKVAIVPTGKRVPLDTGVRLGTTQRGRSVRHYFLVGIDGSADRAAYDEEQAKRRAARAAKRQLAAVSLGFGFDDDEVDGPQ